MPPAAYALLLSYRDRCATDYRQALRGDRRNATRALKALQAAAMACLAAEVGRG